MATLDDIVSVDIHLNTTGVGRANFGTIMVFSRNTDYESGKAPAANSVSTYNRLSDVSGIVATGTATHKVLSAIFGQSPRPRQVKVFMAAVTAGTSWSADHLATAIQKDADWYAAVIAGEGPDFLPFAKAIEAERRLFITDQVEPKVMKAQNLYRTAVIVGQEGGGTTAGAWAAKCLGYAAGSETWALKQLAGIPAASLTPQKEREILGDNGTIFSRMSASLNLTRGGKVAGGEWVDVIRFRDWLQDVMQGNLVATLINRPKLPYTDEGLAVIESSMIKSLEEGVKAGGVVDWRDNGEGQLVRGYTVTVPQAKDVPFNIKASRVAHVSFSAYLTGAIHAIEVTGSFTYDGAL
jgi:hypothetical protein|nr:MAG TPA: tail sheath protein [Caudoviricetes sp.]